MRREATGKVSARQDPPGKGIEVGSGNSSLGYCIHYGECDPKLQEPFSQTYGPHCTVHGHEVLTLVEDSFRRGRCSCDIHSQGHSALPGKE